MARLAAWGLVLLVPCASQPCQSRLDCANATLACVRSGTSIHEGYCADCHSLPLSSCFAPCYQGRAACHEDPLAIVLNLDLLPPYYFVVIAAVTKACAQLYVFPPTKTCRFVGIAGKAKLAAQWLFVAMAVANVVSDVRKLWQILWDPALSIWRTFLGAVSLIAISPNMPSAIGAGIQVLGLGGKNSDDDDKAFGPVFSNYAYSLIATYGMLFMALAILALIGAVLYIWVAVPAIALAMLIGWALTQVVLRGMRGRTDLTDSLMEDLHDGDSDGVLNVTLYFDVLMCLPLVQFLMLAQMRFLDGYGYWESFYLTITERHLRAYVGVVENSVWHGVLLFWFFI